MALWSLLLSTFCRWINWGSHGLSSHPSQTNTRNVSRFLKMKFYVSGFFLCPQIPGQKLRLVIKPLLRAGWRWILPFCLHILQGCPMFTASTVPLPSAPLPHTPAVNVSCLDKTQHFQSHFMGAHWPPSGGILNWSSCVGQGLDPESHVEAILFGPLLCCPLLPTKLVLVYGSSWPLEGSKKGFSSTKKNHKSLD